MACEKFLERDGRFTFVQISHFKTNLTSHWLLAENLASVWCALLVVNHFIHGPIHASYMNPKWNGLKNTFVLVLIFIADQQSGYGPIPGNKIGAIFPRAGPAWHDTLLPISWHRHRGQDVTASQTDHSALITYLFLLQTGQSQSWPDTTWNSRQFLQTRRLQPLKH